MAALVQNYGNPSESAKNPSTSVTAGRSFHIGRWNWSAVPCTQAGTIATEAKQSGVKSRMQRRISTQCKGLFAMMAKRPFPNQAHPGATETALE